ncbi:MAG: aldolase/citrate lyase family protein [Rhodothermales bacterium]
MDLIFISNNIQQIELADQSGVDYVMIDLEINGKVERQGHLNTLISNHSQEDIKLAKSILKNSKLMVRINPIHENSEEEIDLCIRYGAETLMLPMFTTEDEVCKFIGYVANRARVCLLLETGGALARAEQILNVPGIDELHIGLNDLHLSLGLTFMFELISGGLVDHISNLCQQKGLKFGIGGIARLGTGLLPAELILAEHIRLGSSQVILSRDFKVLLEDDNLSVNNAFKAEIDKLRGSEKFLKRSSAEYLNEQHGKLVEIVNQVVQVRLNPNLNNGYER